MTKPIFIPNIPEENRENCIKLNKDTDTIIYFGNIDDNGNKQGKWVGYHAQTRKLVVEANYKNGELDGVRKVFDAEGKLENISYYKNDQEIDLTPTLKILQFIDNAKSSIDFNPRDTEQLNNHQLNKLLKKFNI